MKEVRFFYVPDAVNQKELPTEEAQHALRVLRLREGDEMMLMDGKGTFYRAEVSLTQTHHCCYIIRETLPQQPQWNGKVHLAIAPTKMMERTEWMAEKAVEIGIDELSLLNCQYSERRVIKIPRLEKIVISAVKQSRKAWIPQIHEITPFDKFVIAPHPERKFIAHCYQEIPRTYLFDELRKPDEIGDSLVLIGPEGDFSLDEVKKAIDNGFCSVHLGDSRLRTETAGLAAVMMMQLSKN